MDQQTQQTFLALMRTQSWAREDIAAYQHQLLEKLCRHARDQVPFYRDTKRLEPLFRKGGEFDMAGWRDVPVLTRTEAWQHRDDLHAADVPPFMKPLVLGGTTGSTGTPLPFYRSALSRLMSEAQLARALAWRKLGTLNPVVFSRPLTADVGGVPSPLKPGEQVQISDGEVHYVDILVPAAEQVAAIRAIRPRLVITYPSIAPGWIGAGYDFEAVHALVLTGECCTAEMRELIEAAYAGPILDLYSTSETGPIAVEGADGRALSICEENVFMDEPAGKTARKQPAQVIVTPYYSFGTPLIRYAPGDYAEFAAGPASETPALRRLTRIVGRGGDMFRRRDGTRYKPNISATRLMQIAPHTSRQLIQEDYGRFVLRAVFVAPPSPDQIAGLKRLVAEATGGGDITVEAVAAIADERKLGKSYANFVCRMPSPE